MSDNRCRAVLQQFLHMQEVYPSALQQKNPSQGRNTKKGEEVSFPAFCLVAERSQSALFHNLSQCFFHALRLNISQVTCNCCFEAANLCQIFLPEVNIAQNLVCDNLCVFKRSTNFVRNRYFTSLCFIYAESLKLGFCVGKYFTVIPHCVQLGNHDSSYDNMENLHILTKFSHTSLLKSKNCHDIP